AINGFRVIRLSPLTERNMLVIGLPVLAALAVTMTPPEFIDTLPEIVRYFFGSSVAVGAISAVLLHQVLPSSKEDL
ncbi:MAG: purine permease, partial [Candidatus Adiutrix sp.]